MNFKQLFIVFCSQLILVVTLPVRIVELNRNWILTNSNESIEIKSLQIPSGVYTAYSSENVLKSYNDVNLRWIAKENWTYYINVNVNLKDYETTSFVNLTLHGIDTISEVFLNDGLIGTTNNMFVRYSFGIKDKLKNGQNKISIKLTSPIDAANAMAQKLGIRKTPPPICPPEVVKGECHMNLLRKMQASFGWDWGLAAPSMGIWKSVTLEYYQVAIIRDVDVIISKKAKNWEMKIRVYLSTGIDSPFYGDLIFYAVELLDKPINISFRETPISNLDPVLEYKHLFPEEKVELWWPNGYGNQKLYPLHFTFTAFATKEGADRKEFSTSEKSVRVGFRKIELIQKEIDNGESFYFQVNDVPIFMKGTNYIPSHILPEQGSYQERIKHLLQSAKDAHMNMIRVWGGGVYESDYFYDTADVMGILIWQDMMFACAMYPVHDEFLDSVRTEVRQNAKRIAHHASLAIFVANNENEVALANNWYSTASEYERYATEYRQLYVGTVNHELKLVTTDQRPNPLVSSPSNGQKSVQEGYISKNPQDEHYGDVHYYNFMADFWDEKLYPRPRFSSEYGFQSLPTLRAWNSVLGPYDNLTKLIEHRQHHPLGMYNILAQLLVHLPLPSDGLDETEYWEAYIYFSQIMQAMGTKIETEVYRAGRGLPQNTMGALYWQLNDVWVAPSWSSIDFMGNYKLLHYWAKDFMAPISIIALLDKTYQTINVTISREQLGTDVFVGTVKLNVYSWDNLFPQKQLSWDTEVKPNSNKEDKVIPVDHILTPPLKKNNCFVELLLIGPKQRIVSRTHIFLDNIRNAVGVKDPEISFDITSTSLSCQYPINSYSISIKVKYPAIFVHIEVTNPKIKNYKLSKNGFMQLEPVQVVHLDFQSNSCTDVTKDDIKIITVNQYFKNV